MAMETVPAPSSGLILNGSPSVPIVLPQRSTTVTILGSFLRVRPRGTSALQRQHSLTTSHPPIRDSLNPELSSSPLPPPSRVNSQRRRSIAPSTFQINPSNSPHISPPSSAPIHNLGSISNILRRRRSTGIVNNSIANTLTPSHTAPSPTTNTSSQPLSRMPAATPLLRSTAATTNNLPSHRIRLVPHLDSRRTLRFEPISRDLKDGDTPLRIGRFTDRSGIGLAAVNALTTNKLAFKSKVVSRSHAEVWSDNGKFYIKDTKSSSGTFVNHLRLSPAGSESKPHQLKDGDIVQLGVDYQGGTEDIYKSVKIRIEVGREWQAAPNAFNTNAISQLRALSSDPHKQGTIAHGKKRMPKTNIPDCCICLFAVTIRQALFIAPCSHAFHYKCIRPLLEAHSSAFSCPLCRTFADLEEDVEVDAEIEASLSPVSCPVSSDDEDIENADESKGRPDGLLAPPMVRDGAETEVEGDGGSRPRVRIRTSSRLCPVLREGVRVGGDVDDADFDEDMMDALEGESDEGDGGSGSGSGSGSAEGMGMAVDGEGMMSAKRKR